MLGAQQLTRFEGRCTCDFSNIETGCGPTYDLSGVELTADAGSDIRCLSCVGLNDLCNHVTNRQLGANGLHVDQNARVRRL